MELRESIESINEDLIKEYGRFEDGRPHFRVVWSQDQFEKRWTNYTDEGFELVHPEVRLLPKYRQYASARYILERLVPIVGETDLVEKTGYEPAWVFQDRYQNYLPPFFEGCKYVIESIMEKTGHKGHVKYKDPLTTPEERATHLQKVQDELFGNETDTGDHLAYGTGVVVPGNVGELQDIRKAIQEAESKIELSKLVH